MSNLFFTSESLSALANQIKSYINNLMSTKSDVGHSHNNYAASNHNHNDAYYTETEVDTALAKKADTSHTHSIANVTNLQSALDGKAASSHGTHVSYSSTAPAMDGTASVGSASTVARSDHKHPVDTSRASKTEFDTHAADTTKHITSTERTNWNAAKTHTDSAHAPSNAEKNQNAFSNITVGSTTVTADTATDTVTFVGSNVTITPDATNDKITFAVADGSTSTKGLVQLTNSTSSTSTTTAATPSSVKSAYDLANQAKTAAATAQATADGKAASSHTHNYLPLSGGTMTGQLDVDKVFRNGNTFYNVLEYSSVETVDEIVIKTKIPFLSGNSMPVVHLKGYAYGEASTIEMSVAFYIYNNAFYNMSVVSACPWKPTVYLSSYTENNTKYVAISLSGSIYYLRFVVDYIDIWANSGNRDYSSGWAISNRISGETNSIIPSVDKITVPYKSLAININGNATTASSIAWSGVTSKPSYYDAKAIKSITRNGTTFTYTCMDGTTGTFTQQDNNTTYLAATTGAAGLMSAADKTKLDGIATGANKITVDSSMSATSTNPVQNKVVKAAIDNVALTVTSDGVLVLSK